jgi:hypothetical protein
VLDARLIPTSRRIGGETARAAYVHQPTDGIFTVNDLIAGERLLLAAGLIQREGDDLSPTRPIGHLDVEELLAAYLACRRPIWLEAAAAEGELAAELIPADAGRTLEGALPDPEVREALLMALAQTFSDEERRRIGDTAERAVVADLRAQLSALGREDLAGSVRRVSELSDQLGYDVTAPYLNGAGKRRIEVKGTTTLGQVVSFHLSRNEANVAVRDPDWYLVLCRVDGDDAEIVGWTTGQALEPMLPTDSAFGRWDSAAIRTDVGMFVPGLPPVAREGA